jgi:anhydro-N-acetylmuramic acid kinase
MTGTAVNVRMAGLTEPIRVVGLMSGTSADGIDAALVEISEQSSPSPQPGLPPELSTGLPAREDSGTLPVHTLSIRTLACVNSPFDAELRERVFELFSPPSSTVDKICRINVELGEAFARAALEVIRAAGLEPKDVHLMGSHGQTIQHMPACHATLQIGEAAVIAQRTGITTVSNFRARDMAAGGEGAPLVPYFDWLAFRHPESTRVLQNIGGIANMTVLPAGCGLEDVYAFDNGPGNMIIDYMASALTAGRQRYDEDGAMARAGRVNHELVAQLMEHPFILQRPPKTSGREEFGAQFAQDLISRWRRLGLTDEDMVATGTAVTAEAIAWHLKSYVTPRSGLDEVILSGGGAFNPVLVQMIRDRITPIPVVCADEYGVSSDAKEAIAFAVLAYETMRGRPANVPSATGAAEPVVLGCITPGFCGAQWPYGGLSVR